MRIYRPLNGPGKSYLRTPIDKVVKAMKPIVDNVRITDLSVKQKMRFEKQFISDCMNKKIGNTWGDNAIDKKGIERVLRKAVDQHALPAKWVADRYKGLLTKGGISLSTKWETKPNDKTTNSLQKSKTQSRKLDTIEKVKDFHERLDKSIEARKNQLLPKELRKKEDDGAIKMDRAATQTIPENIGQKITSDKKNAGLASGGIKRVGKPGEKTPVSNIKVKDFKRGSNLRGLSYGMPYAKPYKEVPLNRGISDDALPKFIAVDSGNKSNSNLSDNMSEADNLAEENDWKFAVYQKAAESPKDNFKEEDSKLGGITENDDSFGLSDQKNN